MNGYWTARFKGKWNIPIGDLVTSSMGNLQARFKEMDVPMLMAVTPVPAKFATGEWILIVWRRDPDSGSIAFIDPAKYFAQHPPKKRRRKKPPL